MGEFVPYSCQTIEDEDVAAVVEALKSDFLTQGPQIAAFENEFGARHQVTHCVAVANATAALHIACLALGVGPGDTVWTSPNSFVASGNCARYCGAGIDFVDIDPATRNMSIDALASKLKVADATGTLPKVVIPVDFSGLPCDLAAIRALADQYDFAIVEDASHAVGAEYQGRPVGSRYADVTVFSFHAVKVVTTAEGGMCATNDAELAERMRLLRSHGITRDPAQMERESEGGWYYEQIALGFNYRITDILAALGRSQLRRLNAMHALRERAVRSYDERLAGLPLKRLVPPADRISSHHLYVVEIDEEQTAVSRSEAFAALRAAGIGVNVHYIPIHLQPDYRRLGFAPGDFPAAEAYYRRALTLPLFPRMTDAQQDHVIATLEQLFG